MPQKKNPDSLEYLRGKTGSTYGNLFSDDDYTERTAIIIF